MLGSGIDHTIWLKFSYKANEPEHIFQTEVMDVSQFHHGFTFDRTTDAPWWTVEGRSLSGGHIALPNANFMVVGIDVTDTKSVVYIKWNET